LERLGKLAWLIDVCITRNGEFTTDKELRKAGHDIQALINNAQHIQGRHGTTCQFPKDDITAHIITFLSEFAKSTRYYNIDFLGGKSTDLGDPIKTWHVKVGDAILALPDIKAKEQHRRAQAHQVESMMTPAIVFSTSAHGTALRTVAYLVVSENEAKEINKQAQWKILAIVRYLCLLIMGLADTAHAAGHTFIPDMREHFGFFCAKDAILRRYKSWPPRDVP
jgi:hypothetical protein